MTNRTARFRRLRVALLLLLAAGAAAQTAPEKPYVERVEVNVRTVLVRITDRERPRSRLRPGPEDIAVFEDGAAVRVLGVDPAAAAPPAQSPPPDSGQAVPPPAHSGRPRRPRPGARESPSTSTWTRRCSSRLGRRAWPRPSRKNLDPDPRQRAPRDRRRRSPAPPDARRPHATRRPSGAPSPSSRTGVSGKQTLQVSSAGRRSTRCATASASTTNPERRSASPRNRSFASPRTRSTGSCGGRARSAASDRIVVYFVVGRLRHRPHRDLPPGHSQRVLAADDGLLLWEPSIVPQAQQLSTEPAAGVRAARAARWSARRRDRSRRSASRPCRSPSGGNLKDFGGDASDSRDRTASPRRPGSIPLFARPIDPLRTIADATGGEVVTSANALSRRGRGIPEHLRRLLSLRPPSGRQDARPAHREPAPGPLGAQPQVHERLELRGGRHGTHRSGPERAARAERIHGRSVGRRRRTVRQGVHGDAARGRGPRLPRVDARPPGRRADPASPSPSRCRAPASPSRRSQEFDVAKNQPTFGADIPIRWPAKGRKVAVTVEELKTGTRGTAAIDLPK